MSRNQMSASAADDIIGHLEQARCQIEAKFSRAGAVLEAALDLIGRQLESLSRLNEALDGKGCRQRHARSHLDIRLFERIAGIASVRDARLRSLANSSDSLCARIGEMRGLLKYLLVFALNVKITAAERMEEASEFQVFAQEMRTRIEQGESELNDFEARLAELDGQVSAALRLESSLESKAASMLPSVPNRLSRDADAILSYHKSMSEVSTGGSDARAGDPVAGRQRAIGPADRRHHASARRTRPSGTGDSQRDRSEDGGRRTDRRLSSFPPTLYLWASGCSACRYR